MGSFRVATPIAISMPKKFYIIQTIPKNLSRRERKSFGHFLSSPKLFI